MKGLFGKTKTMPCAFCGATKEWPENFVSRVYAQCLTCWLRQNPEQIEPMRRALDDVAIGGPREDAGHGD